MAARFSRSKGRGRSSGWVTIPFRIGLSVVSTLCLGVFVVEMMPAKHAKGRENGGVVDIINHRDTEALSKPASRFVFSLCLCASVVNRSKRSEQRRPPQLPLLPPVEAHFAEHRALSTASRLSGSNGTFLEPSNSTSPPQSRRVSCSAKQKSPLVRAGFVEKLNQLTCGGG